jgi:uncharacterized Zn-binding protein involved in type VI secretion
VSATARCDGGAVEWQCAAVSRLRPPVWRENGPYDPTQQEQATGTVVATDTSVRCPT